MLGWASGKGGSFAPFGHPVYVDASGLLHRLAERAVSVNELTDAIKNLGSAGVSALAKRQPLADDHPGWLFAGVTGPGEEPADCTAGLRAVVQTEQIRRDAEARRLAAEAARQAAEAAAQERAEELTARTEKDRKAALAEDLEALHAKAAEMTNHERGK